MQFITRFWVSFVFYYVCSKSAKLQIKIQTKCNFRTKNIRWKDIYVICEVIKRYLMTAIHLYCACSLRGTCFLSVNAPPKEMVICKILITSTGASINQIGILHLHDLLSKHVGPMSPYRETSFVQLCIKLCFPFLTLKSMQERGAL